jgi:hypothetical protein
MPATFVELLPPTKTSPRGAIHWTPSAEQAGSGLLEICTSRVYATYFVLEYGTQWDGRAFNFVKVTEGSDGRSESYDVFCSRNGQDHQCSCKGFTYGKGKPCKHVAAAKALIENNWLRGESTSPEQASAPTEFPF